MRYEAFRCRNFALYDHFKAKVQKEIIKAKEQWKSKIRSTSKQLHLWKVANILCDLKLKSNDALQRITSQYKSVQSAATAITEVFQQSFSPSSDFTLCMPTIIKSKNDSWKPTLCTSTTYKLLCQLKPNKSPGSDDIPTTVIRKCASCIAPPLTHLFAISFETGLLPSQWKLANVIPITKQNAKTVSDLRPISLLPIFAKVL